MEKRDYGDYRDSLIAVILPLNRCNQGRNERGRKDYSTGGRQS
jgi:hypothetical protein